MNKLLDAFSNKQKKAERIEGRFQEKRNRLSTKVSKAKTAAKAEAKYKKIRGAEEKTFNKLKKIESEYMLEGRPKTFIRDIEQRKMIEQDMRNMPPVLPIKKSKT